MDNGFSKFFAFGGKKFITENIHVEILMYKSSNSSGILSQTHMLFCLCKRFNNDFLGII